MGIEAAKHGLHFDMPEDTYHAQPALSNSRAKLLVPPSTPLKFKHALTLPDEPKRHFDIGKAVHAKVFGTPLDVVVVQKVTRSKDRVDAGDYDTVSAQAHRDEIRAEGKVPLLRHELDAVEAMAESVLANPDARTIMEFPSLPEVSAFWTDPVTGVECRARFDWLPEVRDGRRLIISDVKTAQSAWPEAFTRAAAGFLYDMQDAFYRDAARVLELDPDPAFLFIVVEKSPPFDVAVVQLPDDLRQRGQALMDRTRRIYADCLATDTWPGIAHGIHTPDAPPYELYKYDGFVV